MSSVVSYSADPKPMMEYKAFTRGWLSFRQPSGPSQGVYMTPGQVLKFPEPVFRLWFWCDETSPARPRS